MDWREAEVPPVGRSSRVRREVEICWGRAAVPQTWREVEISREGPRFRRPGRARSRSPGKGRGFRRPGREVEISREGPRFRRPGREVERCWEGPLSPTTRALKATGAQSRPRMNSYTNRNAHPGGWAFIPLFYQGDVRWENQFRRNRNRQKLL